MVSRAGDSPLQHVFRLVALVGVTFLQVPVPARGQPASIPVNRKFDVLKKPQGSLPARSLLRQAGSRLGNWKIFVGRIGFDGSTLLKMARQPAGEPITRVVRENLKRPIDVEDFLYFLDDVLRAGRRGLRGKRVWVGAGRARSAGIFVHPDEVFRKRSRRYGIGQRRIHIDKPGGGGKSRIEPARDGSVPGPRWIARYPNPREREPMLEALAKQNQGTFAERVRSLIHQLEAQGAHVDVWSTVRDRRRGYLMWGAYKLSRCTQEACVHNGIRLLNRLNVAWNLHVPIRWSHPQGFRATVRSARRMSDAYDVVYATRHGARYSSHYDAEAIDVTAVGLPRELTLTAPDGARQTFDLSAPGQTRDLSLTPELIDWIELHFQLDKLRQDYPHWNDAEIPLVAICPEEDDPPALVALFPDEDEPPPLVGILASAASK